MADEDFSSGYIAVDVENPNHFSRSTCLIGIVQVEPGTKPACLHYLANVENAFGGINISI